jgi:hypothetical protein
LVVGIILIAIPEPATTASGIAMVIHGGTNLAAGITSTVQYNKSNGDIELPTSALGFLAYIANSDDPNVSQISTMADLVDGMIAFGISPATEAPKFLSTLSAFLSASGDIELAYKSMQDAGYMGTFEDFQSIFKTTDINNE